MKTLKKVYIKSEADLPNKKDIYFVHYKVGYKSHLSFNPDEDITKFQCNYSSSKKYWLDMLDWYAVELPELMDDEIYLLFAKHTNCKHGTMPVLTRSDFVNAIREYLNKK